MNEIRVYDERIKEFRSLNPSNYNDDCIIGVVLLRRDALTEIRQDYIICGYGMICKNNHLFFPIDIHADRIVLLEGTYNCLSASLKEKLIQYNNVEVNGRIWSRFFALCFLLGDMNCFDDNGPFIKMCAIFLSDDSIVARMIHDDISIIEPSNYDELCEMTRNALALSNADYIKPDYTESFKYTIDALCHHYHLHFTEFEIERTKNQICHIINKQVEDDNGDL